LAGCRIGVTVSARSTGTVASVGLGAQDEAGQGDAQHQERRSLDADRREHRRQAATEGIDSVLPSANRGHRAARGRTHLGR
jgi:hypothetical protein